MTLTVKCATSKFGSSANECKKVTAIDKKKKCAGYLTWKFKWFSRESLLNFVSLLKAMHERITASPLQVRYV